MTGIYLKCDKCGETFHGEAVDPVSGDFHPHGYHWSQTQGLQNEARAAGWSGDLTRDSNNDRCPECPRDEPSNVQVEGRDALSASRSNAGLGSAKGE